MIIRKGQQQQQAILIHFHKWSSKPTGLLQMIIQINWFLVNDHPKGPASCKWSCSWTCLLQMITRINRSFTNDHPEGPAPFKWSSRGAGLLQMIIRRAAAAAVRGGNGDSSNRKVSPFFGESHNHFDEKSRFKDSSFQLLQLGGIHLHRWRVHWSHQEVCVILYLIVKSWICFFR